MLNTKKIEEGIDKLNQNIDEIIERIEGVGQQLDLGYSELIEEIGTGKKLKKKERKKKALEIIKEKCPNFIKFLDEVDLMAEGIEARVDLTIQKLQETQEKIDEIQELQDELEDKKSQLDNY